MNGYSFMDPERETRLLAALDELDIQYRSGKIDMPAWHRGKDEARRRYWNGPPLVAAADGKYHVTLHGLNPGSDVIRCVVMDDEADLPYEVERFKRDWRKRGYPFETVEVEA